MNWKNKTVIRILLLVARIVNNENTWLVEELKALHAHIVAGDWDKAA